MITTKFFSADGHVIEPADLFTSRLPKKYRDKAPRVDSRDDGDWYVFDGIPPFPVGLAEGGVIDDKIKHGAIDGFAGRRHKAFRAGGSDPAARLKDQDLDNLMADVLYPGAFGMCLPAAKDAEYLRECVRVYNDWIAEFCAYAPDRLLGCAMLPPRGPVEWAIEEAHRAAKLGLRTVLMPCGTSDDEPHSRPEAEPLWSALEELGLPVSLHTGITTGEQVWESVPKRGVQVTFLEGKIGMGQRVIVEIAWKGVAARHPKLKFVIVEGGIGWIASLLASIDHWWKDHYKWMQPRLDEPPSAYFHRQFWATFEDDRPGILTRELLNMDHLMWGSDYPHTEGTFPRSVAQIERDFAGIPEDDKFKIVVANAANLYGATVSKPAGKGQS